MESKEMNGSEQARPKYVWDREKLSWVESAGAAQPGESAAESAIEEPLAATVAEAAAPVMLSAEGDELQLRGAWMRFFGLIIDMVVLTILTSVLQAIFGTDSTASSFLMPLLGFAYFVGLWTMRGQTPGKMAIGARIVQLDGSPPGFVRSFVRYLVFLAYFVALSFGRDWLWLLGVVVVVVFSFVALSRSKRGLHDLAAGTIVINSRPKLMEDHDDEVWEAPEAESEALELFDEA